MSDETGRHDPAEQTSDAGTAPPEGEEAPTNDGTNDDPDDPDEPEDPAGFWAVRPGEVPVLLAGYREAVRQAAELAAAFAAVGLAGEVVEVSAGVGADGGPVVRGVLTLTGACRLAAYLAAGGPPPPGLAVRAGRPPWAA